ncbi:MAG: DUF5063 domain-containing protein [Gammaproteobacteria bacterium]|nr:DUF5063 domain-containing protein [Gammaproteobacteria bacterium]
MGLYSNQYFETNKDLLSFSEDLNHPSIIDKLHLQLIKDAKDFCLIIDNVQYYENREWLSDMSRILSRIQMAMAHLDSPQQKAGYEIPKELDERFELYCTLKEKLGDLDGYWMEFDQRSEIDDQSGSLAGDFSDLYYEFKRGLQESSAQLQPKPSAVMDWKIGYLRSWGQHLLDAQKHLYTLKATERL